MLAPAVRIDRPLEPKVRRVHRVDDALRPIAKNPGGEGFHPARLLILAAQQNVASVTVTVNDDVATYLNNKKRRDISKLEDDTKVTVQVIGKEEFLPEQVTFYCLDSQTREVRFP